MTQPSYKHTLAMIRLAIRDERRLIAARIRHIKIYGTALPSSDPYNPFGGTEYLSKEDAEMFRADLINAILGDDEC